MNQVLVVAADGRSQQNIGALLDRENFAPRLAVDAERGLEELCRSRPDLVIVDLPLTGTSPLDFCRQIQTSGGRTPVIFLSPVRDAVEAVLLLELGADDYVIKPFHQRELVARLRAISRRTAGITGTSVRFGDIEIDLERRDTQCRGQTVELTPAEYNLLLYFVRNTGRVLTRETILLEVWGYGHAPRTRTVDAHVGKLRSKLEADPQQPRHFLTIHGVGYRFLREPTPARKSVAAAAAGQAGSAA